MKDCGVTFVSIALVSPVSFFCPEIQPRKPHRSDNSAPLEGGAFTRIVGDYVKEVFPLWSTPY